MTSHDPITPRARQLFETAADRLDAHSAHNLRRARRLALEGPATPARAPLVLVSAGAVGAAVLALGLAWWLPTHPDAPTEAVPVASALELDAMLTAEDAELYAWLGDAPVATAVAERGL